MIIFLLAADMRFSNRESLYYKKIMKTLSKIETEAIRYV